MDLSVTAMRVVVEVARAGSLTAAARRLGYTQSAVSRQLAAAERAAGAQLFTRHARGVRATAAGAVLVRHAGRALDSLDAAGQELAGLRDRLAGTVVVGGFPTACAVLLPRAMARLAAEHPALRIRLLEASTPRQLQALRRGRLEVAVIAAGDGLPALDLTGLGLTALATPRGVGVAVSREHRFAARDHVAPADLADQAWIVGAGDGPEFGVWPGAENARVVHTARGWPTRLGLVAAGFGIALVPGLAAAAMPADVRWVPIADPGGMGRTMYAATAAVPSAAADAMVGAIEVSAAVL